MFKQYYINTVNVNYHKMWLFRQHIENILTIICHKLWLFRQCEIHILNTICYKLWLFSQFHVNIEHTSEVNFQLCKLAYWVAWQLGVIIVLCLSIKFQSLPLRALLSVQWCEENISVESRLIVFHRDHNPMNPMNWV